MNYEDKPRPGKGFLLVIQLSLAGPLLIMTVIGAIAETGTHLWLALAPGIVILVLVYSFLLHAAYSTVYSIDGGALKMRGGFIKGNVELATVRTISKTGSVTTTLGWGFGSRAICNRFSDIVVLKTSKEKIFISPTDPDIFIEQLRSLIPDSAPQQSSSTGDVR